MAEVSITRSGAETLIPEDYLEQIIQEAPEDSIFLRNARRLPDMSTNQKRMSVLETLPIAYFNNAGAAASDTSYKRTSNVEWKDKFIDAEELSVIVPIPENVLEDTDRNVWDEITPLIREAIGNKIDGAVFFGTSAPNAWPDSLYTGATSAGNSIAIGANGDLYDDILGEDGLVALLEQDGYFPNGFAANVAFRGKLRGVRYDQGGGVGTGEPIFQNDPAGAGRYMLDGQSIQFSRNGAWDAGLAHLFALAWDKIVYSIRKDITYKMLDQAIIQDPATSEIVYNLAQQDMVALRVVMRLGWQVPNPVNRLQPTEANRYPAAVLTPVNPS